MILNMNSKFQLLSTSGSELGVILLLWELMTMPGAFGVIMTGRGVYWHLVGRGQDAAKYPTTHKTAPTALRWERYELYISCCPSNLWENKVSHNSLLH